MTSLLRIVLVTLIGLAGVPAAHALESAPVRTARATATLVSEVDSVTPGQPFRIGLRLRMTPGWHTYWKNPGDAGAPAEITLTLPDGASADPIDWPTPGRMPEGPLMTYGYSGEVLLPVTIRPAAGAGGMRVTATASWLICKDICVPEEATFVLDLPAGATTPSPQANLFKAHDRSVPRPSPWQAHIAPDGTLSVRGQELGPEAVREAWFIPDQPNVILNDAPQTLAVTEGGLSLALRLTQPLGPTQGISGIVSMRDRTGQQADVVVRAEPGPGIAAEAAMPLIQLLGFAFLGGLILNLMPCVFPVLAMKAMALARGSAAGHIRGHALSYTLGVLSTFAVLGGALLVARSAGAAAGWGFQFQSPVFVAAMAWLLFGVGLNLSGVFQFGGSITGAGSALANRGGHAGSFFTGLLAVLVATPCTAPFMGVAIAAGLAAPPVVTISVFLAMGLGLASPYVLLAGMPSLGRYAPRPGAWMDVLKQVLAFPMYGAAVWLLWVISQSAGPDGVLVTATGFVLVGFAFWALGASQGREGSGRRLGQGAMVLALLATLGLLGEIATTEDAPRVATEAGAWSPERLDALRQEGRPVFVNMTAAWCVTCLVNERVALRTDATTAAFVARGITYLKGDWTRQDPAISAYLRQFNRDGVPLYVYYPPGSGAPVLLPQILTEGIVLAALEHG